MNWSLTAPRESEGERLLKQWVVSHREEMFPLGVSQGTERFLWIRGEPRRRVSQEPYPSCSRFCLVGRRDCK